MEYETIKKKRYTQDLLVLIKLSWPLSNISFNPTDFGVLFNPIRSIAVILLFCLMHNKMSVKLHHIEIEYMFTLFPHLSITLKH